MTRTPLRIIFPFEGPVVNSKLTVMLPTINSITTAITNDLSKIQAFIGSDRLNFAGYTGTCISYSHANLERSSLYIMIENTSGEPRYELIAETSFNILCTWIEQFSIAFWSIKDCSVSGYSGAMWVHGSALDTTLSIPVGEILYNSNGEIAITHFTEEEILRTAKLLEWLGIQPVTELPNMTKSLAGWDRANRAVHLLNSARRERLLSYRIAGYMICLESLFTRDSTELAHKVSERCAVLFGNNKSERTQIYDILKRAYGIRSKCVHGQESRIADSSASEISTFCDELIRKSFSMSGEKPTHEFLFQASADEYEQVFLERLFA
jgi:hypothetical protein